MSGVGSTASPDVPVRLELIGPPREVVFTQSVRRFGVKVNEPIDTAPQTIPAIRAELSSTERPPRPADGALEEAMIREGALLLLPGAIKLEPTGLFFAEIPLPASAPPGRYSILIFHDHTGAEERPTPSPWSSPPRPSKSASSALSPSFHAVRKIMLFYMVCYAY